MSNKIDKQHRVIFNSRDIYDDDVFNDIRDMLAECNDCTEDDVPDLWVYDTFNSYLDDEKYNLNIETDGVIVAFMDLGFWYGRRNGAKIIGTNVRDTLNSFYGGDDCDWYCDQYNAHCKASHHDGTHYITFRLARDMEQAKRLVEKIAYDGMTEKQFRKATKSIRPFIAKVYGW